MFQIANINTHRHTRTFTPGIEERKERREEGRKKIRKGERNKERKSGNHGPRKEENKSAPTLSEQSQEPHLVHSECHTLSWGGAPGEQEDRTLSSAPAAAEEQGLRDHPWRDPCTPLTGHRSPGMTPGGYGPTAAVNPGGPTEGLGT